MPNQTPQEILTRSLTIRKEQIDTETRTVELSFSSEEPYERWFGVEILDHSKSSVKLDRLKNAAPLLLNHWTDDQIGVIEKAWIKDRKGFAVVRFGKSDRASEVFNDVVDGIRKNVSVGYLVNRMQLEESGEDTPDVYRVTEWTPMEVSIVPIPADNSVGVGRATSVRAQMYVEDMINQLTQPDPETIAKGGTTMTEKNKTTQTQPEPVIEVKHVPDEEHSKKMAADAVEKERNRIADITALGKRFNKSDLADQAIADGTSLDAFRGVLLDNVGDMDNKPITVEDPAIGMGKNDIKNYSFFRMLRAQAFPQNKDFQREAGFELEVSATCAEKFKQAPKGLFMPFDVYNSREVPFLGPESHLARMLVRGLMQRDLTAGTATDGAELVATNLLAGSFIDVLRNLTIVMDLGARVLPGLVGDVAIPRKTSGASAGWIATETTDVAESDAQFDQVTLTPNTLGAFTDISRQLLLQSTPAVEGLIRDDLAQAVAIGIDAAALYGTGATGQPQGISTATGVNTPAAFAAAVPTWAEVVAMESAVAVDNALFGSLGYAIEPAMRGSLKTSDKGTDTGKFIMESQNELNGYRCAVSSQITSGDVFFGNWADLLIGFWGALDVLADPYSGAKSGLLTIVVHQSCDVGIRHGVSFAFNNDTP